MANTFDWIEIRTGDAAAAAAFYEQLFGWQTTDVETAGGTEVRIFDTGGEPRVENLRRGGIWLRPGEPPGVVVYVRVDDIEAVLRRVVALGGRVAVPRIPVGAGHAAFFTDPGGALLGLYEEQAGG